MPAARNSFSSGGGWHGDRHAQENEVCVRREVLAGEMGGPRKAALPEDFQPSHSRHVTHSWDESFVWPPGHSGSWLVSTWLYECHQKRNMLMFSGLAASGSDTDTIETNTIFQKRKQPSGPTCRFLFCFEGSHGPTHPTPTFEKGEFAADWKA